jgi:hypothetical protein
MGGFVQDDLPAIEAIDPVQGWLCQKGADTR